MTIRPGVNNDHGRHEPQAGTIAAQAGTIDGALLQVIEFCNLACKHCSQDAPTSAERGRSPHLGTNEWTRILRRLNELGVPRVRFTGGEPFLRRDLEVLAREADSLGLSPSFVSNGHAIHLRTMNWLSELRSTSIWISLYGYPSAQYEERSGRLGSFSRCLGTIEALTQRGIEVGLYYTLEIEESDALEGRPRSLRSFDRLRRPSQAEGPGRPLAQSLRVRGTDSPPPLPLAGFGGICPRAGSVVAKKRSNSRGAKGPCCT